MSNGLSWAGRIRERNRSRSWLLRLPIFIWLVLLVQRYLRDPSHTPIWDGINLAFHELGHVVFLPFPDFLTVLGGTLLQILVPLVAGWILIRQKDDFGGAVALFWLGTNLMGIAIYAGDARSQALPLVSPFPGEIVHDWNYLLGTLGLLESEARIARLLRTGGYGALLGSLLVGGAILLVMATDPVRRRNRIRRGETGDGWARSSRSEGRAENRSPSAGRVSPSPEGHERPSRSRVPPWHVEEDRAFARWWANQARSEERPFSVNAPLDDEIEVPLLPDDLVRRSLEDLPASSHDPHPEDANTRAREASIRLLEERARKGDLSPTELRFLHWLRRQR